MVGAELTALGVRVGCVKEQPQLGYAVDGMYGASRQCLRPRARRHYTIATARA